MFSQIEHYRILREIGGGGFAKVYLAEDEQLRREVAIKVLHANLAENTDFRRFFEREARLVASLEHLAVVPIYDYGEINGQLFLVMRYMRGGTLADRLEKIGKALPLAEVIALLERLAPTLDTIHERGVIHRDLKPSNILYDESGSAYIADFGIARMQQATTRYTQTGISFGTPQYSSPEQVTGEGALDHRSDIYTLGVILYQLLTGEYPFWSDTPLGWVHKHAEAPIPNIREVNRALPQGVQSVIEGTLAKAREDRYGSSKAILDDLKRAVAGQPILFKGKPGKTVARNRTPKQAAREKPNQNRLAWWSAAGAVILVIVALGLLFWQNWGDGQAITGLSPSPTVFIDGGGTPVQLTISPTTSNNGVATPGSNTTNPPTSTPLATQAQATPTEAVATPTIDATAQAIAALEQLSADLQTRDAFFAPYLRGTPHMDGDLSEWGDAFFQELSYVLFRPENVLNSTDLAAECAGAWDLEAFYLACRIRDETLVQVSGGERLFQGDSVELLLDERVKPDGAHSELDGDDFQIGVLPGGAFGRATEVYRWYPQNKAGTLTTVAVGSQPINDGYTVEMRILWAELGGTTHVGAVYGFGLNINDNDTPKTTSQESQLSLFEGQQLRNPTTWGLLVLLGEP